MEYDRYQKNHMVFISGLVCLVLCISFFLFSLYITPYLIWNLSYQVPDFVISLINKLHDQYEYSEATSRFLVGLLFFIPAIITGLLSDYISNKIDNQIYHIESEQTQMETNEQVWEEKRKDIKESAGLGLRILILMILTVAAVLLLQFLL